MLLYVSTLQIYQGLHFAADKSQSATGYRGNNVVFDITLYIHWSMIWICLLIIPKRISTIEATTVVVITSQCSPRNWKKSFQSSSAMLELVALAVEDELGSHSLYTVGPAVVFWYWTSVIDSACHSALYYSIVSAGLLFVDDPCPIKGKQGHGCFSHDNQGLLQVLLWNFASVFVVVLFGLWDSNLLWVSYVIQVHTKTV